MAYNDRVTRIENQIISRLRDKLATARSAQEMFRVFSKFNTLFVRPKIRGAIQEYQTRLIESVKEDILQLRAKFTANYRNSQAYHMSQMRDIPSVSSAIIWARQIERQLLTYMKRVEDVLGRGWESYAEGHKLQVESAAFRAKLDTRPLYEAWVAEITRRGNLTVDGRLFDVVRGRAPAENVQGDLYLVVQFDPQVIALFKEVRALIWLGYPVPLTISHRAKDAKRVYPHAVSLMESVRIYTQTLDLVEHHPDIAILLASYRTHAQQMIGRGVSMQWDHLINAYEGHRLLPGNITEGRENRHFLFVREFASVISLLQDKATVVIDVTDEITRLVDELVSCSFDTSSFEGLLAQIQKQIDHLNLENYSNLDVWVASLNDKIAQVLRNRLRRAIDQWCADFVLEDAPSTLVHEIKIRNQVIYLDPPIELARQEWLIQFQDVLGVVCHLSRVRSSRYEISLQADEDDADERTFIGLVSGPAPSPMSVLIRSCHLSMTHSNIPLPSSGPRCKKSPNTSTSGCLSKRYGISRPTRSMPALATRSKRGATCSPTFGKRERHLTLPTRAKALACASSITQMPRAKSTASTMHGSATCSPATASSSDHRSRTSIRRYSRAAPTLRAYLSKVDRQLRPCRLSRLCRISSAR